MSEQRPQNQNEQLDDINEKLLDNQYLEESAELDSVEDLDEPAVNDHYADVPSAADSPAEGVTGRWKNDGPTQVEDVLSRNGSIFGEVPSTSQTTYSEKIAQDQRDSGPRLSEVISAREAQAMEAPSREINPTLVDNKADKGLSKGNVAPKPEEDVDAAREEVKKSFETEDESGKSEKATEEPTSEKRTEVSAKISATAEAAARPVKKRRSSQDRSSRVSSDSRNAVDKARAEGEAKRAAKAAKEAEAPQTPPIMGEGGVTSEKKAKQTVVTEGTDGQQYVTAPTIERPKSARISAEEVKATVGPAPEAVVPTQPEKPEESAPAEEPKKVIEGTIVPDSYGSSQREEEQYQKDLIARMTEIGQRPGDKIPEPISGPTAEEAKAKSKPTSEEPTATISDEQIDEGVLGAMGGYDSGRPAKRGGKSRKARRQETAAAETSETNGEDDLSDLPQDIREQELSVRKRWATLNELKGNDRENERLDLMAKGSPAQRWRRRQTWFDGESDQGTSTSTTEGWGTFEDETSASDSAAETPRPSRPTPNNMPGARGRKGGPTPADMPGRRPQSHGVNEQAPVTPEAATPVTSEAPASDTEKPANVSVEINGLKATRFEAKTHENVTVAGITIESAYRKDPVAYFGEKYRDIVGNNNEDTPLVNADLELAGVFDGAGGVGGKDAGLKASRTAAKAVEDVWVANEGRIANKEEAVYIMRDAVAEARYRIYKDPENEGMTTGTIGKIMEFDGTSYLIYGQVGDSRMAIYKPDTQELIFQTEDQQNPNGSLYNAINGHDTSQYNPDKPDAARYDRYGAIELPENARVLFCTDGITGSGSSTMTGEQMLQIFKDNENATATELADAFVKASTKVDDKTVVIMDFQSKAAEKPADETSSDDAPEYEEEEVNDTVKAILKKYENGLDVNHDTDEQEPSDLEAEVLKTAKDRDTRTPEEVEADDEAAAEAKDAAKTTAIAGDTLGAMRNSARNRLGGFGDRSRLGATALGGEDTSWADDLFDEADDLDYGRSPLDVLSREPLDDPFDYLYRDSADTNPEATSGDNEEDDDDDESNDDGDSGRSLADDLLGDADFAPARRSRRERVGAAFRTGWDKARTYFAGRDIDSNTPDRDRRIAGRQLKVVAGAVGATVLAGALFSGLTGGDTANEGPKHVGKGPSASAEKTPGAKVDSGKTESKPKESLTDTGSDKKESKKPSATVDDHRREHGQGIGNGVGGIGGNTVAHTFDVGRETVKVSSNNEVVVTLKQGGTIWDALDRVGDELHINHSDDDISETIQSMHLKPGQDRHMKVGSSYTFKVQGGKLVAKK